MFEWVEREVIEVILKQLYEQGYRYVVRDKDSIAINCYSLKPKKYMDIEGWGYPNPDLPGVMMAYPIRTDDMAEINWTNRSPKLITEYIKLEGD